MTRRSLSVLLLVVVIASCGGSDDAKGPTATVGPDKTTESTTTTKPPTPEQEVEAAYLRSWDVYAKAVRTFDTSELASAYVDGALQTVQAEVERLAAAKTPLIVKVTHDAHVQIVDEGQALVRDRYVNRNYRVDADGKPLDPTDDPGTYQETYQMKRSGEAWLVMRIVRESHQS